MGNGAGQNQSQWSDTALQRRDGEDENRSSQRPDHRAETERPHSRAGEQSGGDDGGGTDTRAGRHSQQVGIGKSVTDEGLHHRAGDGKTSADGQTEQYPRCSDPPHDRKFGTRDGWASKARVHHVHHSGHGEHLGSECQRAHSREHGDDQQSGQHDTRTEPSSRRTSLRRKQVGRWRQSSANSIHGVTDPSSWHDTTSTRVVSGYGRRRDDLTVAGPRRNCTDFPLPR